MKLNPEQHGKGREVESASGLERGRRSPLARARSQLSQAVGDVLSGFEGKRQGGGWLNAFGALGGSTPAPHVERLREVVIRDRALFAANPRPRRTLRDEQSAATAAEGDAQADETSAKASTHDDAPVEAVTSESPVADPQTESAPVGETAHAASTDEETLLSEGSASDAAPTVATPLEELAAKATKTKGGPSKEASAKPRREPIRTRTMARLLASQGHRGRALSIYDDLLAANGSDATLRAEADALRGQPE